ncbi:hypothetical protein ACPPVT_07595 [Angustibacter sp. McL0619]|uniref:hypothetical protein n=1 Tax=Angustibacter sp. McL0619 TaxID=3415676 RepID=UPI003CEECE47
MMPGWLARHLEDQAGAPLGARTAKPRLCPCGAWTLLGLDAAVLARTARVDPTPLTTQGELVALLAGRPTYILTNAGGRLHLDHRDRYRTTGRPPHPGAAYDVVPTHQCGTHLTGHLVTTTNLAPAATPTARRDHAAIPY